MAMTARARSGSSLMHAICIVRNGRLKGVASNKRETVSKAIIVGFYYVIFQARQDEVLE
jgi:hypothetical protein